MNKSKATLNIILVALSIISLSASCKKDEPEPVVVACNPHSNEAHNDAFLNSAFGQKMRKFWVKDKEYEGDCSSKEISFTGIGHNTFGITNLGNPQGSEYTADAPNSSTNEVFTTMTGAIVWSDGYDNFTLPSDPNINYEILSVTNEYLIVRTDDSPNVLRYKAKY